MTEKENCLNSSVQNAGNCFHWLINKNNVQVCVTSYGATLVSFLVPDKDGNLTPIVPGFASIEEYNLANSSYYGSTIGRFANRIAHGKFSLNGDDYQVTINDGGHSMHGGNGIHNVYWTIKQINSKCIKLHYLSPDGDDGFPGNLDISVIYILTDENELKIDYEAATDADTVVNLSNHVYFNLNGVGNGLITDHWLMINADSFTPVDDELIPDGSILSVEGTPFDFRVAHLIGERIEANTKQLKIGAGYDHNFVLNKSESNGLNFAAKAWSDRTGIVLEVLTTEPGLQLYTGNFMDSTNTFTGGKADHLRTAFALETQHFPNSPNVPAFPSTLLKKGETFVSSTIYKASVKNDTY